METRITLMVALLVTVARVVAQSEKDGYQDDSDCWEKESDCIYDKNEYGGQSKWRSCWLRCVCTGFTNGVCELSSKCMKTGEPWTCKCSGKAKLDIMQSLCRMHGYNYWY